MTDTVNLNENGKKKRTAQKVILAIVITMLVISVILFSINTFLLVGIEVSGSSMESTLNDGDIVYASKYSKVDYGDIIIIKGEKNDAWIVKRVIGLGGDTIEIKDGYVYRNGLKLERDKQDFGYTDNGIWETSYTLEEDEVFFLGDNRPVSKDSRSTFGCCKKDQVVGVVTNWSMKMRGFIKKAHEFTSKIRSSFSKNG